MAPVSPYPTMLPGATRRLPAIFLRLGENKNDVWDKKDPPASYGKIFDAALNSHHLQYPISMIFDEYHSISQLTLLFSLTAHLPHA